MIKALQELLDVLTPKLMLQSILSACSTILILHAITLALQLDISDTDEVFFAGMLFIAAFCCFLIVQLVFQTSMINLTESTIKAVRLDILDAVRQAKLLNIERFGTEKIMAAIAYDANAMSQLNQFIAVSIGQLFTVIAAVGYMFYIAPVGALCAVLLIALAILFYHLRIQAIQSDFEKAREAEEGFFQNLNDMLMGVKEVKQNALRSDVLFHEHLVPNANKVRDHKVRADSRFVHNQLILMGALYLLAALAVFVAPFVLSLDSAQRMSFVLITLFMVSPFHSSMELFRILAQVRVCKVKLEDIKSLAVNANEVGHQLKSCDSSQFVSLNEPSANNLFNDSLMLNAVTHQYPDGFKIGPISLEVLKGETIFISGGNGSGKTTFLRMLTGLYHTQEGDIYLDERPINKGVGLAEYRALYANVSADSMVFSRRYGQPLPETEIKEWINYFGLADKVTYLNGGFSTTQLSTGQMKRLALIQALAEQRDILVLDEFAANLDPQSKYNFYHLWLPKLKSIGKTVFVITHDEHYFHLCDKHFLMREGQLHRFESSTQPLVAAL